MLNLWQFHQEVFWAYVTSKTLNCPLIRQSQKYWAVKRCVTYTANLPHEFCLQFPHDHVSCRILDTTHIPTPSYVCLVIITAPHQRSLMHNTVVCKPNVGKPQAGDQRDHRGWPRLPPPSLLSHNLSTASEVWVQKLTITVWNLIWNVSSSPPKHLSREGQS